MPPPMFPERAKLQPEDFKTLTKDDVLEMIRLRQEDPATWSIHKLAEKFGCTAKFVIMATRKAPREHLERVEAKLARVKERWGPSKTKARADRQKRAVLLQKGQL